MDIEQFKKWLDKHVSSMSQHSINKPSSLTKDHAFEEATFLLEDLKGFHKNKDSNVCVVVFEYEDGYQVDVESNIEPSFQIFKELYSPPDIGYVFKYDEHEQIKKLRVK